MNIWLAVFLGGGFGSVARLSVTKGMLLISGRAIFPWATLISNILATAILAYLVFHLQHELEQREVLRAFLMMGFCGGFSTFSTFSYENFLLVRDGSYMFALLNISISVIACFLLLHIASRTT